MRNHSMTMLAYLLTYTFVNMLLNNIVIEISDLLVSVFVIFCYFPYLLHNVKFVVKYRRHVINCLKYFYSVAVTK